MIGNERVWVSGVCNSFLSMSTREERGGDLQGERFVQRRSMAIGVAHSLACFFRLPAAVVVPFFGFPFFPFFCFLLLPLLLLLLLIPLLPDHYRIPVALLVVLLVQTPT